MRVKRARVVRALSSATKGSLVLSTRFVTIDACGPDTASGAITHCRNRVWAQTRQWELETTTCLIRSIAVSDIMYKDPTP